MAGKAYIHCSFPRKTDGYELGREGQRWPDKPRNRSAPPRQRGYQSNSEFRKLFTTAPQRH